MRCAKRRKVSPTWFFSARMIGALGLVEQICQNVVRAAELAQGSARFRPPHVETSAKRRRAVLLAVRRWWSNPVPTFGLAEINSEDGATVVSCPISGPQPNGRVKKLVGVAGFEPATPTSRTRCAHSSALSSNQGSREYSQPISDALSQLRRGTPLNKSCPRNQTKPGRSAAYGAITGLFHGLKPVFRCRQEFEVIATSYGPLRNERRSPR